MEAVVDLDYVYVEIRALFMLCLFVVNGKGTEQINFAIDLNRLLSCMNKSLEAELKDETRDWLKIIIKTFLICNWFSWTNKLFLFD